MDHLFEDLLVIDAASFLAGPGASTILGDFGARVIKIEPPQGDGYRLLHGRHRHDFNWSLTSRHKEGMVIDLNQTEGQALLHELVAKADVFVSNFREDQSQRYGADASTLRALNPRLIYAQFTGFGSVGPDREKRGSVRFRCALPARCFGERCPAAWRRLPAPDWRFALR